ncbi:MAG: hypothetical protein KY410_01780 [Proteobacteria bacterium]|nr:hypothetical protein [Pseudomonadota bacterium]
MKLRNWIWLLLRNFVIAAVLLGAIQWLKRGDPEYGIEFGLIWGAISGLIFTGAQYHRWRRNVACALCEDLPKREES